jgi:hypothetical protein
MNENLVDMAADNIESIIDYIVENEYGAGIIVDVPIVGTIVKGYRAINDFRNRRFMERIRKLLIGIDDIRVSRDEFFSKFQDEKQRKEFCSHLINVIDAISEDEKIDIEINLFRAFLLKKLDINTFRRFTHLVENCFYADLRWLPTFNERIFSHKSIELQGLIGTCLIEGAGSDAGSIADDDSGGYYYCRTESGKLFCDMAFRKHSPLDII